MVTVLTDQRKSRIRPKRYGPRSLSKRGLLSRAMALGWPQEDIDKLRAETDITRALEAIEAAEADLVEAVSTASNDAVDYDALVADWPELSDSARDRLALLLRGGGRS